MNDKKFGHGVATIRSGVFVSSPQTVFFRLFDNLSCFASDQSCVLAENTVTWNDKLKIDEPSKIRGVWCMSQL